MDITKHSNYREFLWATELSRFGLGVAGLWPKVDEKCQNNFASDLRVGIIFVIINFLTLIPLLCSLAQVWGDMTLMVDNLEVTLTMIVVSMKLVILRWKQATAASILKMMLEDWIELKVDTEKAILIRQMQTVRTIAIFMYAMTVLGFIVLIILPLFGLPFRHFTNITDGNRLLPLQGYYFYDTDKSPQYELTIILQGVAMFFASVVFTSTDTFLVLCISHICSQFEIFRYRLNNWILWKDFDSALRKTVQTHRRLIRFARNIEDTFSFLMLGLLLYFGIVFCLFTFLLLTVISDNNTSVSAQYCGLLGAFALFVHTLLYCGGGEMIVHHCEEICRATYDVDWYKLESRKARSLILLMMRVKEPSHMTAGKIVPLTMATFCNLLKTTAGYISFLLAIPRD